jgi:hypothetical protein
MLPTSPSRLRPENRAYNQCPDTSLHTHPKDLPVENYDKVGLALNLRTAREIGVTIRPSVRLPADKVIQ